MVKYSKLIAPLVALFILGSSAIAVGLPIDTGYSYNDTPWFFAPYPVPTGSVSTRQDNYWINIASSPTLPVQPSWVLRSAGPWALPISPNSRWIGPRNTLSSAPGTSQTYPSYTLFRKCFCLAPGFNSPSLSFRVMNDDSIQIFLNTQLNTLYGPAPTMYATYSPLVTATAAQLRYLHAGTNCIYALLEDTGGWMGFDLAGTFNANGLYPYAAHYAAGAPPNQTFGRCPCAEKGPAARANADERQVVNAIVKIAESRRRARKAR
jgi:hypothetical protein